MMPDGPAEALDHRTKASEAPLTRTKPDPARNYLEGHTYYSIRHLTKFAYKTEVSESIMETRMHPRSDQNQRCLTFHLSVSPRCRVFSYRDHLANHVHHFDIPGLHGQLVIVAESLVEMQPHIDIPKSLPDGSWEELDRLVHEGDFWEMLLPSEFATPTPALEELANHLDLRRRDDPLSVL